MKIGFSFIDLASGGAQILLIQLAKELARRGHIISYYLYAPEESILHRDLFLVEKMNSFARPLSHPVHMRDCEIIQLDGYHSLRHKWIYLLFWNKCFETFHSIYSLKRSGPIYCKNRIAVSQYILSHVKGTARVIYNGIHLPDNVGHDPLEYDICILGRFHPVKNHHLFFSICQNLFAQRKQLSALVIGGLAGKPVYQSQMKQEIEQVRQMGINLVVTGTIPYNQVNQWLRKAKIQLITSEDEGFGQMAIEGMGCRLPIIANPVGGLTEIVVDGVTGFLPKRNDPESFARHAMILLENESLRENMGQAGRERVKNFFTLEKMVDSYEDFYKEVYRGQG
jgi:glycosyltransferase involved in cell wall biosynthesis